MSKVIATKRVLVIGYGAAGSQLTAQLAKNKKYAITVVTPFDYQEVSLFMTKAVAMGAAEHSKIIFPLLREDRVDYVIDSCVSLTNTTATLASGNKIEFDVCVLATGQKFPLFFPDLTDRTKEIRLESVAKVTRQIAAARTIVISGGGPTGVILVQPNNSILSTMKHRLPELAARHMREIDVELVNNDRVVSHIDGVVTLKSGMTIPCDVYIPCFSTGGNATFLSGIAKDSKGFAVVDDTLTVASFRNVFALGDCSNYDHLKIYSKIADTIPVVVFNINAVLSNTPLKHHVKGATIKGSIDGPGLVTIGHGLPEGWGVGPNFPGSGHCAAVAKSWMNEQFFPKKGK
eukprot:gene31146-38489_t